MKEAPGSSKIRFLQEPHGVTTQKTPFFIVTAVKTSTLTFFRVVCCKLLKTLLLIPEKL
jgi:hypothetical protein